MSERCQIKDGRQDGRRDRIMLKSDYLCSYYRYIHDVGVLVYVFVVKEYIYDMIPALC